MMASLRILVGLWKIYLQDQNQFSPVGLYLPSGQIPDQSKRVKPCGVELRVSVLEAGKGVGSAAAAASGKMGNCRRLLADWWLFPTGGCVLLLCFTIAQLPLISWVARGAPGLCRVSYTNLRRPATYDAAEAQTFMWKLYGQTAQTFMWKKRYSSQFCSPPSFPGKRWVNCDNIIIGGSFSHICIGPIHTSDAHVVCLG